MSFSSRVAALKRKQITNRKSDPPYCLSNFCSELNSLFCLVYFKLLRMYKTHQKLLILNCFGEPKNQYYRQMIHRVSYIVGLCNYKERIHAHLCSFESLLMSVKQQEKKHKHSDTLNSSKDQMTNDNNITQCTTVTVHDRL